MDEATTDTNGSKKRSKAADADALARAREEAKIKLDELWPAFVDAVNATDGCEPATIAVKVAFKPAKQDGPASLNVSGRSSLPTQATEIAVHVGGGTLSLGF